jgi:hypothetical protein
MVVEVTFSGLSLKTQPLAIHLDPVGGQFTGGLASGVCTCCMRTDLMPFINRRNFTSNTMSMCKIKARRLKRVSLFRLYVGGVILGNRAAVHAESK